jgi:phenylpropionate dioxygenase-like ring-hydroxylating dioxygenase large terminal subunit
MERIWERTWVYCGHESQVPKHPGDYHAVQIGRQPMVMVRGPTAGATCSTTAARTAACSWCGNQKRQHRQRLRVLVPRLELPPRRQRARDPADAKGYEGTRLTRDNPDCQHEARGARRQLPRLRVREPGADGPTLQEFLGEAKVAFDDMCDRSPVGEVEVVPVCHRVIQHSNWKFFMENQLDALHPSVTHQSTGISPRARRARLKAGRAPAAVLPLPVGLRVELRPVGQLQTLNFPRGHGILKAYMGLRPQDPDTLEHEAQLKKAYGEQKAEEYLSRSIHHVLVYPYLSVQSPLQQLRCMRPLAPDKTLSEIWHFRLKGAPEAIYRRSLWYFNLVNSPSTMINADDLENWTKGQWGLKSEGGDWVSFHRDHGARH